MKNETLGERMQRAQREAKVAATLNLPPDTLPLPPHEPIECD